jgi:glycosyltransferase involved in cell wall biosynthesis
LQALVSVIIPIYNERENIEKCLKAIKKQTYPRVEIIVVDNGSTDVSFEIAKNYADKVILEKRKGISFAKNTGLKAAIGELIATTDADCIPDERWLEELVGCFDDLLVASAGGPNITPPDASRFEKCGGMLLEFLSKGFGSRYISDIKEITETFHNPGCNVMYRRSILNGLAGFNEQLLTVEDEELDFRIKLKGYKILSSPYPKVYHNRRSDWRGFVKQVYRYAIGRMQFIKFHYNARQWPRFLPSVSILAGVVFFILGLFDNLFFRVFLMGSFIGITGLFSIAAYLAIKSKKRDFFIYVILLFLTFLAWGIGFIRGVWYRQR